MDATPNLGLPYIMAAQSQKHVTHNEAIRALDAVVQLSVLDRHLSAPPGSPAEGARYIIAPSPTGAWSGHAGSVTAYQDGAWMLYAPSQGWIAWVADEDIAVVWSGSAWVALTTGEGGGGGDPDPTPEFETVAINGATADMTNRLSLNSEASLFNHDGDGHQIKINKATPGDTASLLYQTGFSGRAELGLAGDDDFHFKVSADGSIWNEAIVIDKDTGEVAFPNTSLGGGGGAPTDAEYIVKSANGGLSAERVLTDTATVAWDYATGGQAKGNVPNDAITYAKLQNVSAADKILGRATSGAGDVEEIACTAFARSILDDADAAAARTTLGLTIGTNVQAYDADLSAVAGLSPSNDDVVQRKSGAWANRTLAQLLADLAALGTTFQPLDADLSSVAGLAPSNDDVVQRKSGAWANRTLAQLLADLAALGTTFQPLDADLTAVAGLSPSNDDIVQRKSGAWTNRTPAQVTADLAAFTGDSGSGGLKGLVPAPAAGDAAAGKFLHANGSYAVPSGGGGGGGGGRELLTASRTYYVRTDGSDSNNGLGDSSGAAFLTRQYAYDVICATLDLAGHTVTVQIDDGTYTGGVDLTQSWTGGGSVIFRGNTSTPANVVISTTSDHCYDVQCPLPGVLQILDQKMQTTTTGACINVQAPAIVQYGNVNFGAAQYHVAASGAGANAFGISNYAISGGGTHHWLGALCSQITDQSKTITITGTPAFTAFARVGYGAQLTASGNTFSGSATGARYQVLACGVCNAGGAGASYLPGGGPGSTATGAQYV